MSGIEQTAPVFKPPFDIFDCPTINPDQHLGYRHIVAYLVGKGIQNIDVITDACAQAEADKAPTDAIYKTTPTPEQVEDGEEARWVTVGELAKPVNREYISLYVDSMAHYEEQLAEYEQARKDAAGAHTYQLTVPATVTVTVTARSLSAAREALKPAEGHTLHEVREVDPCFAGRMRLLLDHQHSTLIGTDDPQYQQAPATPRKLPLSA